MSDHSHTEYVEGCFRCELSRDEVAGLDSSDWDFPKIIRLDTPIVDRLRTRSESWADGWELDALTDREAADEIERLREQVAYRDDVISMLRADYARLSGFLHPIGATTHPPCSPTNRHTVVCKCDGRRVVPFFVGSSLRADGSGTRPCDCDKCEGEARRG